MSYPTLCVHASSDPCPCVLCVWLWQGGSKGAPVVTWAASVTQDMTRLFTQHLPSAIASINTGGGKRTAGKANGSFAGSNLYGQGPPPPREEARGREGLQARVVPEGEGQGGDRTETGDGGAPAPRIP